MLYIAIEEHRLVALAVLLDGSLLQGLLRIAMSQHLSASPVDTNP
jgi:hypothetical protein